MTEPLLSPGTDTPRRVPRITSILFPSFLPLGTGLLFLTFSFPGLTEEILPPATTGGLENPVGILAPIAELNPSPPRPQVQPAPPIALPPELTPLGVESLDPSLVEQKPVEALGQEPWLTPAWPKSLRIIRGPRGAIKDIRGEILTRRELRLFLEALTHIGPHKGNHVIIPEAIQESLQEQWYSALSKAGIPPLSATPLGHRFSLSGTVSSEEEKQKALSLAKDILILYDDHLHLPQSSVANGSVKVSLIELSRKAHEELGVSWPPSTPLGTLSWQQMMLAPQWPLVLRHLAQQGLAKVLAEPTLALRMDKPAELKAGGEIPIRVSEKFENRLVWRFYGIHLRIGMTELHRQKVRLHISLESSQLDSAVAVGGLPGVRTNKMETEVDTPWGQPITLSGLFTRSQQEDHQQLPWLSQLPLIGGLFSSENQRQQEQELLINVIPLQGLQGATAKHEQKI